MNHYPPQERARPETLQTSLAALHKKIKQRAETVLKLDMHPDTTPEQAAECHARNKAFHAESRTFWKSLKSDLQLINVPLVPYEQLPFVASPFIGLSDKRNLPLDRIKSLIQQAKQRKA